MFPLKISTSQLAARNHLKSFKTFRNTVGNVRDKPGAACGRGSPAPPSPPALRPSRAQVAHKLLGVLLALFACWGGAFRSLGEPQSRENRSKQRKTIPNNFIHHPQHVRGDRRRLRHPERPATDFRDPQGPPGPGGQIWLAKIDFKST